MLGRVIEAASGQRLGDFMAERIFKPLGMKDTAFHVPEAKAGRLAVSFDKDPATGLAFKLIDVSKRLGNDSGGAGSVSTAADYLRFSQMMLNGGTLDSQRSGGRRNRVCGWRHQDSQFDSRHLERQGLADHAVAHGHGLRLHVRRPRPGRPPMSSNVRFRGSADVAGAPPNQ